MRYDEWENGLRGLFGGVLYSHLGSFIMSGLALVWATVLLVLLSFFVVGIIWRCTHLRCAFPVPTHNSMSFRAFIMAKSPEEP
jgi:hypothetical protein